MPNVNYEVTINANEIDSSTIESWFKRKNFIKIKFKSKKEYVSTFWLGQVVGFKIAKVENYKTFYKIAASGSILIFECKIKDNVLNYNCYSPIWLFGVWNIKLNFKKNPSVLFKYLKEGYRLREEFEEFLK